MRKGIKVRDASVIAMKTYTLGRIQKRKITNVTRFTFEL